MEFAHLASVHKEMSCRDKRVHESVAPSFAGAFLVLQLNVLVVGGLKRESRFMDMGTGSGNGGAVIGQAHAKGKQPACGHSICMKAPTTGQIRALAASDQALM